MRYSFVYVIASVQYFRQLYRSEDGAQACLYL